VALLPGSRTGEIGRLAEPMIGASAQLAQRRPGMQFVCAAADAAAEELFASELQRIGGVDIHVVRGDPRTVIAAADCVLCASGTATLETLLVNRPLVMTYRVAPSTYRIGRWLNLVKLEWFSLPNILAGHGLVPELIQDEATPENLARAVEAWLDDDAARAALKQAFSELHENLRCNAADRAAAAVADLLANKGR
jgi:lipid-A-disaccharide synthase